jgi:hypothetical protein
LHQKIGGVDAAVPIKHGEKRTFLALDDDRLHRYVPVLHVPAVSLQKNIRV